MKTETCMACDGCGWCEGSPAWTCTTCDGTGEVCSECKGRGYLVEYRFSERQGTILRIRRGKCECQAVAA